MSEVYELTLKQAKARHLAGEIDRKTNPPIGKITPGHYQARNGSMVSVEVSPRKGGFGMTVENGGIPVATMSLLPRRT